MSIRLCIVLVNYNGLADTLRCLRSLEAAGRPETVVVDNASTGDPMATLRQDFSWCRTVRNPVNGGWAGGNNTGIRSALQLGAERIVLLNNDTIVAANFVERLNAAADAHPRHGILGPVIRFMEPPHEVMTDGCRFNAPNYPGFFQRVPVPLTPYPSSPLGEKGGGERTPAVTDVDIVNGCCMMVRAEVFERIGLIDERFFLIHEESDFCLRAAQAGFGLGVFGEALVWHKGSSSFKRTGKRIQRYYDTRNLYLLLSKHADCGRQSRGPVRSRLEYLRHAYYRYSIEFEAGQTDAARAVLEGLCDALARRFGPFQRRAHPLLPLLRGIFDTWHAYRQRNRIGLDATAVR